MCRLEEEEPDLLDRELEEIMSHPTWALELHLGPLEEQCLLLMAELSL